MRSTYLVMGIVIVAGFGQSGCAQRPQSAHALEEPAGPTLVIQGPHAAAWIPIDNAWTPSGETRRDGILIHVGRAYTYEKAAHEHDGQTHTDDTRAVHTDGFFFKGIEFTSATGTYALHPDTTGKTPFSWINIVAGSGSPIDLDHIQLLYPSSKPTACVRGDCGIPEECLVSRRLHPNFKPSAILTYWQGPKGYSMEASQQNPTDHPDPHNMFTFRLLDGVSIEVHDPDDITKRLSEIEENIRALGELRTITIQSSRFFGDPDHGEIHEPPISWGL